MSQDTSKDSGLIFTPPSAPALIEALRGMGYSVSTAIADIVDNSIAAGATKVAIKFKWEGTAGASVRIDDDGVGMDEPALIRAMSLGVLSPLDERSDSDLGRFGLGLKTASFSQCRSLTVVSKTSCGDVSALRWDLDKILSSNIGWAITRKITGNGDQVVNEIKQTEHGTSVIWEKLDRIVTPHFTERNFLDLIDRVERHLSLTFHRFLRGDKRQLSIQINGRALGALDPFMTSHPATWESPVERFHVSGSDVVVQAYVLPHQDKLSASDYQAGAGDDGWTSQQGFYVYRNGRLLVGGGWLGIGEGGKSWTREEMYRLARIRLEFTSRSDDAWKIDIRKSIARPPVELRERLTQIATDCRRRARSVFAYRGHVSRSHKDEDLSVWIVRKENGKTNYGINWEHPIVKSLLSSFGNDETTLRNYLLLLEATVPIQRIWMDVADDSSLPEVNSDKDVTPAMLNIAIVLVRGYMSKRNESLDGAIQILMRAEPFNRYPELAGQLKISLEKGN